MASGKYFVLQSTYNRKYLEYVTELGVVHGLNKFIGESPVSPYGIYKIEKAKIGGGLVHIKCCYNNKYLVRWSPNQYWITSTADKPEEDKCKWSCTLFEILPNLGGNTTRLRHVQLGVDLCHKMNDPCLIIRPDVNMELCYDFTIQVGQILKDGTDTGVNSCNFKYETKEEKKAACDLIEQLASEAI